MSWKVSLLMGLIVPATLVCSIRFIDIDRNSRVFAITVEHVVHVFNESQDDEFAFKFLRTRRSQRKVFLYIYLVDVEMGRTICKKYDEDIDNCPLQEGPGKKTVRCTFIVETFEYISLFTVLNSTCVEI